MDPAASLIIQVAILYFIMFAMFPFETMMAVWMTGWLVYMPCRLGRKLIDSVKRIKC